MNTNELGQVGKVGLMKPRAGSVAERIAKAKAAGISSQTPVLALLLDCSDSMSSYGDDYASNSNPMTRIEILRLAVKDFVENVDFAKNRVSITSFPLGIVTCPPTNIQVLLTLAMNNARADGGTPMGAAMRLVLATTPQPERAIIISDGDATDNPLEILRGGSAPGEEPPDGSEESYDPGTQKPPVSAIAKRTFPIFDCIHIGESSSGEETLKEIARLTGGIYMKFKDLNAFRAGLKYLTPSYRAMLTSGNAAELTGATGVAL